MVVNTDPNWFVITNEKVTNINVVTILEVLNLYNKYEVKVLYYNLNLNAVLNDINKNVNRNYLIEFEIHFSCYLFIHYITISFFIKDNNGMNGNITILHSVYFDYYYFFFN